MTITILWKKGLDYFFLLDFPYFLGLSNPLLCCMLLLWEMIQIEVSSIVTLLSVSSLAPFSISSISSFPVVVVGLSFSNLAAIWLNWSLALLHCSATLSS